MSSVLWMGKLRQNLPTGGQLATWVTKLWFGLLTPDPPTYLRQVRMRLTGKDSAVGLGQGPGPWAPRPRSSARP